DGLGPGDLKYKFLKSILRNPLAQWLYRRVHPDTGVSVAEWFSERGPKHVLKEQRFLGPEREWLVQVALDKLKEEKIDYFIFGHSHIAVEYPMASETVYVSIGECIRYESYAVFDGKGLKLKYYKSKQEFISQRALVMIRHAKSSWAKPLQSDFERPLNARGE